MLTSCHESRCITPNNSNISTTVEPQLAAARTLSLWASFDALPPISRETQVRHIATNHGKQHADACMNVAVMVGHRAPEMFIDPPFVMAMRWVLIQVTTHGSKFTVQRQVGIT